MSRFAGAALKAGIALRGAARAVECCGPGPAMHGAFKLDIRLEEAARETGGAAFDAGVGETLRTAGSRRIEKLRAWIGQPTVEWGFLSGSPANERPEPWSAR